MSGLSSCDGLLDVPIGHPMCSSGLAVSVHDEMGTGQALHADAGLEEELKARGRAHSQGKSSQPGEELSAIPCDAHAGLEEELTARGRAHSHSSCTGQ